MTNDSSNDHDNLVDNDSLVRDLEIEVFSSTKEINLEKCLNILKKLQYVNDVVTEKVEESRIHKKDLESKLLDQQIEFEKTTLEVNENVRTLDHLTNEKIKCQDKYEEVKRTEELSQKEFKAIDPLHKDLQRQSIDVDSLNKEIVGSEFERRNLELGAVLEELKAVQKELNIQKTILSDTAHHCSHGESSHESALKILNEKRSILKTLKYEVETSESKIHIDKANKGFNVLEEELRCVKNEVQESRRLLLIEDSKVMEKEQLRGEVERELKLIQDKQSQLEDEVASISTSLSMINAQLHSLATTRMQLEIDLREAKESLRHENTSVILQRKQLERMKVLYLKKKRIVEKTQNLLQEMEVNLLDKEKLMKNQDNNNDIQSREIETMRDDINIKITHLMEQQYVEEEVKEEYKVITEAIDKIEREVIKWKIDVKKQNKIISILNIQSESQKRKIQNVISNERETMEMVRLKKLVVLDMRKALCETNKRVSEFGELCEVMKGKRNEIENAISITDHTLVQMQRKLDEYQQTLQNLHQSQELKEIILSKECDAHSSSKMNISNLRVEKTKLHVDLRQKRDERDRLILQIEKLKSTLTSLQREVSHLKIRNGTLENGKQLIVEQLEDKKIAIHELLQRANAYEEALKKGEMSIQQKKEDIRAINLQCASLERIITLKKTEQKDVNLYKERISKLENELNIQRDQVKTLGTQVENPIETDRWRELGGEDPDDEQLDAKISVLEERLIGGRERLMERKVLLEETKTQIRAFEEKIKMTSDETQPMMMRLSDYQFRHHELTRSLMAAVSEFSMYQAILLKLKEEKEYQEERLNQSRQLLHEGMAPSDDALRDLRRLLRDRDRGTGDKSSSDIYTDEFGHTFYPASYALRTTAEPRPTAYLPDTGIEIPMPYGNMAPFKPTELVIMKKRRISHQD